MADKPLQVVGGRVQEVEAKQTSAGAGDAGRIPALGADGKLDASMLPAAGSDDAVAFAIALG